MENKAGNEIIAIFMGGYLRDMGHGDMIFDHENYMSPLVCKDPSELEYDNNWSWLMPVVEKIENLTAKVIDKVYVSINGKSCNMWNYYNPMEVLRAATESKIYRLRSNGRTKIEATWLAVIDFIKWYNELKTKS